MRKTLSTLAAAATFALTTLATPTGADAQWGWRWGGGGYGWRGPGFVGSLAAGAFLGAALSRPYAYGYYGPYASYGYYGSPYVSYAYSPYYGGPYTAYASSYYSGYYAAPVYSCSRTAWNGYAWVRSHGC